MFGVQIFQLKKDASKGGLEPVRSHHGKPKCSASLCIGTPVEQRSCTCSQALAHLVCCTVLSSSPQSKHFDSSHVPPMQPLSQHHRNLAQMTTSRQSSQPSSPSTDPLRRNAGHDALTSNSTQQSPPTPTQSHLISHNVQHARGLPTPAPSSVLSLIREGADVRVSGRACCLGSQMSDQYKLQAQHSSQPLSTISITCLCYKHCCLERL